MSTKLKLKLAYMLTFYGSLEINNSKPIVYLDRDKAILAMINHYQAFETSFTYEEVRVQKNLHDLDSYLVSVDLFVNNESVACISLLSCELVI